jgi:hypothetical protein
LISGSVCVPDDLCATGRKELLYFEWYLQYSFPLEGAILHFFGLIVYALQRDICNLSFLSSSLHFIFFQIFNKIKYGKRFIK